MARGAGLLGPAVRRFYMLAPFVTELKDIFTANQKERWPPTGADVKLKSPVLKYT